MASVRLHHTLHPDDRLRRTSAECDPFSQYRRVRTGTDWLLAGFAVALLCVFVGMVIA